MERASKFIRGLGLPGETITAEELACAAWAQAVGKKIAAHTRPVRLVRSRLVIEVEDAIWQRQLFSLGSQIVRNLDRTLGTGLVTDLEFRVVPRRREPGRALAMAAAAGAGTACSDEADAIADPVLRRLYKVSRQKALA